MKLASHEVSLSYFKNKVKIDNEKSPVYNA
jgi:hypothetical protein